MLALSQDLMFNRGPVTKKKRKVVVRAERQLKPEIKAKKEPQTKKKSLDEDSKQLVQLLTAMGFPENYIEYALTELGGQTRPEQLVAWLLENPDVKVVLNLLTLHDGGPHHIETSPLICCENQWTGF